MNEFFLCVRADIFMLCSLYNFLYIRPTNRASARFVQDGGCEFSARKTWRGGEKRRACAFGVERATGLSGEACRYRAAGINITGFTIDEKLRRTSIGKSLMEAVEHFAEQNGFAFIRAESGAMRKAAHAAYRKLNFYSEKTQIRFLKKIE